MACDQDAGFSVVRRGTAYFIVFLIVIFSFPVWKYYIASLAWL